MGAADCSDARCPGDSEGRGARLGRGLRLKCARRRGYYYYRGPPQDIQRLFSCALHDSNIAEMPDARSTRLALLLDLSSSSFNQNQAPESEPIAILECVPGAYDSIQSNVRGRLQSFVQVLSQEFPVANLTTTPRELANRSSVRRARSPDSRGGSLPQAARAHYCKPNPARRACGDNRRRTSVHTSVLLPDKGREGSRSIRAVLTPTGRRTGTSITKVNCGNAQLRRVRVAALLPALIRYAPTIWMRWRRRRRRRILFRGGPYKERTATVPTYIGPNKREGQPRRGRGRGFESERGGERATVCFCLPSPAYPTGIGNQDGRGYAGGPAERPHLGALAGPQRSATPTSDKSRGLAAQLARPPASSPPTARPHDIGYTLVFTSCAVLSPRIRAHRQPGFRVAVSAPSTGY
ncbi:hypothetical protein B0H15DRAFT_804019 [Mycena belliarum]|uniref:Uncharacterized protein n=1 Tax=Mycena belliarum TaxID=1033014 RepID=A0AAD6U0I1_9AGAR|nr:hypothetical protein B0H15DRAFT_804019 [Mycena belliae]